MTTKSDRKTQIAIESAYRLALEKPNTWIFWVFAANKSRFMESFRSIARQIGLIEKEDRKSNYLDLVREWLQESSADWFLIVDNADDSGLFLAPPNSHTSSTTTRDTVEQNFESFCGSRYLPQSSNGRILITSRNQEASLALVGDATFIVPIGSFEPQDTLDLLKRKLPFDKSNPKDFEDLAEALEHIPLAIIQACGYITAKGGMFGTMSVYKYLTTFKHGAAQQAELLSNTAGDLRRDPVVPSSVIDALQLSFEQIQLQYPDAIALLLIMSELDRQGISRDLLLHFGLSLKTIDEALGTSSRLRPY